ncbi:uncharacterized protein ARMOST_19649 [Armillaria ostoyae]|uniref:F-box domain-containing protein n=1 Tax=Armillaria ostoyae TaxID=47428 RepID=A0A284S554_ARMOS|nr:uncharacterized protein ARMOST_19649 [Armillaria ostoyae]
MSCLACSNCGFVNFLPPESQLQTLATIQGSDSLVLQFLRGSRPLLDDDYALISAEIAKLERLRSLYDAQLQEIDSRRRPVLRALEHRKSIYAPIRRVPRDILLEIFHSVCDSWWQRTKTDYYLKQKRHSLNVSGPLWVLGRVCGLWRDTLHASPVSWARNIEVKAPFSEHAPHILRAYLSRTGEHPLSIKIVLDSDKPSQNREIMSLLLQSCYRWKNACIHISMHHLKSIPHLPLLQTIEVHIVDDTDRAYRSDMCLNSPQLRRATFIYYGIHQMRLPPSGITHYSGNITCAEDLQLLSQLPMLEICHIPALMLDLVDTPVIMIALRQLYVGELHVLDFLTAPMLQSLAVARNHFAAMYYYARDCRRSIPRITRFLRRSRCQLQSLNMHMKIFQTEPSALISEMLSSEACSTISHLTFKLGSQLVKVANTLAPSSVLPNLHRLVLCMEGQDFRTKQTQRLVNMIRSRRDAGLLKTIEVQFGDSFYHPGSDEDEDDSEDDDRWTMTDVEAGIRALTGDNLEVWVERCNPADRDLQLLFWDGEIIQ